MAKIQRLAGDLVSFASNATDTERKVFGTNLNSDSLDDNVNDDFKAGWGSVEDGTPTMQHFNSLGFTLGQLIAYHHQMGVPEYDAAQDYYPNSVCTFNGTLYISLVNNINVEPGDVARWRDVSGTPTLAWSAIDGPLPLDKLPDYPASKITTGTILEPRIDRLIARAAIVAAAITTAVRTSATAIIAGYSVTWADIAGLLPTNKLPNHSASKITSGRVADARLASTIARRAAVTSEIATSITVDTITLHPEDRVILKAYGTSISGFGLVVATSTGSGLNMVYTNPSSAGKQYMGSAVVPRGVAVPASATSYTWEEMPGRIRVTLLDFGNSGTTLRGIKTLPESILNFTSFDFEAGHINPGDNSISGTAIIRIRTSSLVALTHYLNETIAQHYIEIRYISPTQFDLRAANNASFVRLVGIR